MGILPQGELRPRRPLLQRSQSWSSLCPPLVLFLPGSRIYHIPTSSPLKLGVRWSIKPDSGPKINPNCWTSNEELKTYVAFVWIPTPIEVFSATRSELYPG
jgi:hypothetical protein